MTDSSEYAHIASKAQERGHPSYVWRDGQSRRLSFILRHVPVGGRRVLDAGCGVGMYAIAFRREGAHVYGLEIEPDRAEEAGGAGVAVAVGSIEALPFRDASFDLVLSHEVIEHVNDDALSVRETARVLAPGGHLVLFAPNRWYPFETHGIVWKGRYRFGNFPLVNYLPSGWRNRLCPHARAYRAVELRQLCERAGLQVVAHTQIYPGFDNIVATHPRLGRLIRAVFHALEKTPLRWLGLSHFVVAVRSHSVPDA